MINTLDDDIDGDGIKNFEDLDSDSSGDSVAATPETTQARVPRSFFGVVSEDIFWASRPDLPERPLRSYQIW